MPTTKLTDFKTKRRKKNKSQKPIMPKQYSPFHFQIIRISYFIDQKQYSSIQKHIQLHDSNPFFFIDKLRCMDHEFDKLRCMNHESPPSSFILLLFVIFLVDKLHIHPMDLKSINLSSNQLLWKKKMSIELKLIAPYYIYHGEM